MDNSGLHPTARFGRGGWSPGALDRTEVIPGGCAAFSTLPTGPRLTAGASFALVVSQACVPTCPEMHVAVPEAVRRSGVVWRHELPA